MSNPRFLSPGMGGLGGTVLTPAFLPSLSTRTASTSLVPVRVLLKRETREAHNNNNNLRRRHTTTVVVVVEGSLLVPEFRTPHVRVPLEAPCTTTTSGS